MPDRTSRFDHHLVGRYLLNWRLFEEMPEKWMLQVFEVNGWFFLSDRGVGVLISVWCGVLAATARSTHSNTGALHGGLQGNSWLLLSPTGLQWTWWATLGSQIRFLGFRFVPGEGIWLLWGTSWSNHGFLLSIVGWAWEFAYVVLMPWYACSCIHHTRITIFPHFYGEKLPDPSGN